MHHGATSSMVISTYILCGIHCAKIIQMFIYRFHFIPFYYTSVILYSILLIVFLLSPKKSKNLSSLFIKYLCSRWWRFSLICFFVKISLFFFCANIYCKKRPAVFYHKPSQKGYYIFGWLMNLVEFYKSVLCFLMWAQLFFD